MAKPQSTSLAAFRTVLHKDQTRADLLGREYEEEGQGGAEIQGAPSKALGMVVFEGFLLGDVCFKAQLLNLERTYCGHVSFSCKLMHG